MAYNKTIWQNGVTPLNDDNLNNIENGIANLYEHTITIVSPTSLTIQFVYINRESTAINSLSAIKQLLLDSGNISETTIRPANIFYNKEQTVSRVGNGAGGIFVDNNKLNVYLLYMSISDSSIIITPTSGNIAIATVTDIIRQI